MNARVLTLAACLAALPSLASPSPALADSVVTYHNSPTRHGAYLVPSMTIAAAANMHPDRNFHGRVKGHIYAQPLFWQPATGKAVIVAATESNFVYALDADSGAEVWKRQLGAPIPLHELPCGNIDPVGITGTPIIDPAAGVLYVDALARIDAGPKHLVYALSLADGSIVPGWPVDVKAGLAKLRMPFSSAMQGERSALQLFGGALYVNYGGNWGDCGTYHGTVVQIETSPPKLVAGWQTRAPSGGGIWAQGGLAADDKSLFATTGNTFSATTWSDGEAIFRLKPGLVHSKSSRDYFTPSNWLTLDDEDQDLGGTEALPIDIAIAGGAPVRRVIAFGKDGNAYLVDRENLGGIGGQVAMMNVSGNAIITAPAVYQTKSATMVAFTNYGGGKCSGSSLTMLNVAANGMSYAWCAALNGAGAPIVTTTDGASNAIVWVVGAEGDNMLHGFNALTGQTVFGGAGTAMAGLHHFVTPLAAARRLYVGADDRIYAFDAFEH